MDDNSFVSKEIYWIKEFYPGSQNLLPKNLNNVLAFGIIWNIFEGVLNDVIINKKGGKEDFSYYTKINCLIDSYGKKIRREDFLEEFNYFLKRYKDKDLTKELNFRDDKFTEKKAKEFLEDIFANSSEESPCKEDMVKALGYIIYRIRNNYFHGIKPTKSLPSQNENFRNVNRVIINLLETIKR